jgi:hypothetical protein
MTKEEFIAILKSNIVNDAFKNAEVTWLNPPGRNPDKYLLDISAWYCNLSDFDKEKIKIIAFDVLKMSVFSLLTILDDVTKVTDEEGKFELYFTSQNGKILLNNPDEEYLHDIFNS